MSFCCINVENVETKNKTKKKMNFFSSEIRKKTPSPADEFQLYK